MKLQIGTKAELEEILYQVVLSAPKTLVLSGGSSFTQLYIRLGQEQVSPSHTEILFADERCVPATSHDSTYGTVQNLWFAQVAEPLRVHRVKGELSPEEAAQQYQSELEEVGAGTFTSFDLVLLGVGPDGHVASLFPGSASSVVGDVAVTEAERPPFVLRVTLTPQALNRAARVFIFITGEDKREVAQAVVAGNYAQYPLALIKPEGELSILVDTDLL